MNNAVPLWATILIAFGVALLTLVGVLVTQAVQRKNAKESNQVARDNSLDTTAAAKDTVALEQSKSNREMIRFAVTLQDGTPDRLELSYNFLEGIARMPGLSEDDAALVQSVMRPVTEQVLDQARRLASQTGEGIEFVVAEVEAEGPPVEIPSDAEVGIEKESS